MSDLNENDIRISVRQWLSKEWDATMSLLEWRSLLVDSRWAVPSWPEKWFGRAYPAWADDVVRSELLSAGTVATPVGASMNLAAPTIMKHGGDKQKQRFLRPALTGEETWCQLFSEPIS